MSALSTPTDSPVHVEPLHKPDQAAQVVVPQAPLGNVMNGKFTNQLPGMGAKALLAKKMAKSSNPKYISPTDNMMTPCSQKISAAKKKRFDKGAKPMQQLSMPTAVEEASGSDEENVKPDSDAKTDSDDEMEAEPTKTETPSSIPEMKMDDPENPF